MTMEGLDHTSDQSPGIVCGVHPNTLPLPKGTGSSNDETIERD